eukprot:7578408-Karenia_brevis.AAC.1
MLGQTPRQQACVSGGSSTGFLGCSEELLVIRASCFGHWVKVEPVGEHCSSTQAQFGWREMVALPLKQRNTTPVPNGI